MSVSNSIIAEISEKALINPLENPELLATVYSNDGTRTCTLRRRYLPHWYCDCRHRI